MLCIQARYPGAEYIVLCLDEDEQESVVKMQDQEESAHQCMLDFIAERAQEQDHDSQFLYTTSWSHDAATWMLQDYTDFGLFADQPLAQHVLRILRRKPCDGERRDDAMKAVHIYECLPGTFLVQPWCPVPCATVSVWAWLRYGPCLGLL